MPFSDQERQILLDCKGIGPVVIQRLEESGIHSLEELSRQIADELCHQISVRLGASCWRNSPQARSAVTMAITIARAFAGANKCREPD